MVADITDSRQELDKVVYEANKPIYGSDEDGNSNEDEDEGSEIEGDWESSCCEDEDEYGDCDCDGDDESEDYRSDDYLSKLEIRNYIENKLSKGEEVTLKLISSLKTCREEGWRIRDVAVIVSDLGFLLLEDENEIMSNWKVES